jgi:dTDP-4-dehydrorhamnose reductase
MLMKVLVTGATGQVGSALLSRLEGIATLVGADRTMLDLSRPENMGATLDRIAPDLLINAAAYTAVDKAEDEQGLAFLINAEAPGALARWCAGKSIPLIHFSTDYVFDGTGTEPWTEEARPAPLSAYGKSKLVGEEAIRSAGGPSLIMRTSWVYAAKGTNFLRTIARLAREKDELRIVADQIGAPTSAALVADAVATMLKPELLEFRQSAATSEGLVHFAAGGEASWYDFATDIVEGLRARGVTLAVQRVVPIATSDYPTKAKRPLNSRLSLQRLKTVFGITPKHWHEALSPELDALAEELRNVE